MDERVKAQVNQKKDRTCLLGFRILEKKKEKEREQEVDKCGSYGREIQKQKVVRKRTHEKPLETGKFSVAQGSEHSPVKRRVASSSLVREENRGREGW